MIFKDVLIAVLLIAAIVAVIFLIILLINATDTIKKVNAIMDGSTAAAEAAKEKMDNVSASVKEVTDKVGGIAAGGINAVSGLLGKLIK